MYMYYEYFFVWTSKLILFCNNFFLMWQINERLFLLRITSFNDRLQIYTQTGQAKHTPQDYL